MREGSAHVANYEQFILRLRLRFLSNFRGKTVEQVVFFHFRWIKNISPIFNGRRGWRMILNHSSVTFYSIYIRIYTFRICREYVRWLSEQNGKKKAMSFVTDLQINLPDASPINLQWWNTYLQQTEKALINPINNYSDLIASYTIYQYRFKLRDIVIVCTFPSSISKILENTNCAQDISLKRGIEAMYKTG